MELSVYKVNGSSSGSKVKLPAHVFGIQPNEHAVYLSIKALQANARQGTASSKNRSAVRGGGKKPWKQKGRGVARAGTIRSPLWVGGGRIFGPLPRNYRINLPKKVKTLARLSIYSDKVKSEQIKLVEDFKLKDSKTKEIYGILKALGLQGKKTLLLLSEHDPDVLRAGRNIPGLIIRVANTESTYDLLNCEVILLQESVVNKLSGIFKK